MQENKHDSVKYRKNFLTAVLARVDFSPILSINTSESAAKFQDAIGSQYPKLAEGIETKIKTTSDEAQIDSQKKIWKFSSSDDRYNVSLSNTMFSLETRKYTTYEDFLDKFTFAFGAFMNEHATFYPIRMGFRYINEIDLGKGKPFELEGYISPSLTSQLNATMFEKTKLTRQLVQTYLKEDDYQVRFFYGMFNRLYPSVIVGKEFLLDIDCFTTNPEKQTILPSLNIYHTKVQRIFEASIDYKLRALLNE